MLDFYRFEHLKKQPSVLHLVSTKSGLYPYTFSLALHTGEDAKAIIQNRQMLAEQLVTSTPLHFIVANQTHSDNITVIREQDTKGWEHLDDAIENCDALITNVPHVVLSILTADCVPVLLYDLKQGVIAAIHAGWKGTQQEIVIKTLKQMKNTFASNPEDILAGIAPSIGRCCYEVGEDVAKHFFDTPMGFTKVKDKYMLDLPYLNKKQLLDFGVKEENIEMSNICTACHNDKFFSYRKEKGCSGRFMSIIGLKDLDENTRLLRRY